MPTYHFDYRSSLQDHEDVEGCDFPNAAAAQEEATKAATEMLTLIGSASREIQISVRNGQTAHPIFVVTASLKVENGAA